MMVPVRVDVTISHTKRARLDVNRMTLDLVLEEGEKEVTVDLRRVLHEAKALHRVTRYTVSDNHELTFPVSRNGTFAGIRDTPHGFDSGHGTVFEDVTAACAHRAVAKKRPAAAPPPPVANPSADPHIALHQSHVRLVKMRLDSLEDLLDRIGVDEVRDNVDKIRNWCTKLTTRDMQCLAEINDDTRARDDARAAKLQTVEEARTGVVVLLTCLEGDVVKEPFHTRLTAFLQAIERRADELEEDVEFVRERTRDERDAEGYANAIVLE